MTRENKWLIINAIIFVVISAIFIVGFVQLQKRNEVKVYQKYISEATSLKHESIDSGLISRKTILYKGNTVVGHAYLGSDSVEGIPGTTGFKELRIEVIVDKDHKIKGVRIDHSEHTPEYVEFVLQYFDKLPGTSLIDYKFIDEVAGASAKSMPIVRDILDQVTKLDTGQDPNPVEEEDPYLELFEDKDTVEEDETFAPTEAVTKKEIIKDASGTVLGYAYTVSDTTVEEIPYTGQGHITFLIGVDENGIIVGIYEVENNHSKSDNFYNKYNAILESIPGTDAEDVTIDIQAGATISGNALSRIFEALKAVL